MKRASFVASALAILAFGGAARAEIIYGMTSTGSGSFVGLNLVRFDSASPGTQTPIGAFSGATAGHSVFSIDFRPANQQLYAVSVDATGTLGQLYTVNLATAALTSVGPGFSLGTNNSVVSMDFNPVADRLRIVSAATGTSTFNNNFRVNPNDGLLAGTDTNLSYAPGDPQFGFGGYNIVGAAYSNNVPGATQTTLYGWDYQTDTLLTIGNLNGTPNNPNTGLMFTVNTPAAFLTTNPGISMDISGDTGILYVTHDGATNPAVMGLFTRDVTTGAETSLGAYGAGVFIVDLAVQPIPEPGSLALCAVGAAGLVRVIRRRKKA